MSTEQVYHYVYRITNIVENKHYYGKRSSKKVRPSDDLGRRYFSSSTDKLFIQDQKSCPQNYKYKIVSTHSSASKALAKEIKLHRKFNVDVNTCFYNKAKQTSTRFSCAGLVSPMKNKTHTKESKRKMSIARKGIYVGSKSGNTKLANIYNYTTGDLIAEKVAIVEWCKENPGYTPSALYLTASCNRLIPSSANNTHHHKNICALYITDKDFTDKEKIYRKGVEKPIKTKPKSYPSHFTTSQKISQALKGKPKSLSHIQNSAKSRTKLVDIRKLGSNELIAHKAQVKEWCINNGYTYSKLYTTLKADRNIPHNSRSNPHHHKQIYAEYS